MFIYENPMPMCLIMVFLMSTTTTFQNHVEKRIKEMREREKQFRTRRKN